MSSGIGVWRRPITQPVLPIVATITPSSGKNTQATPVTITGQNFTGVIAVRLDDTSATLLTGTISVGGGGTQITGLSVPQGVTGGEYNVIVTTPQGSNSSSAQLFTVTALPVVTTITPDSGINTKSTPVTIVGSYFGGASSVRLDDSHSTVLSGTPSVNGTKTVITGLSVPSGITVGKYNVVVTTPVGSNSASNKKFSVYFTEDVGEGAVTASTPFFAAFPNPASASATLSYRLLTTEIVKLSLIDGLGRSIQILVHEKQDEGEHAIQFPVSNLSTGIYLCRLESRNDVRCVTLIVIQ